MSGSTAAPPLVVAIDFTQPQSYLAKGPTRELAAEIGVEIDWQATVARSLLPPAAAAAAAADDRGARHRRFRARYLERNLDRYARSQGLVLRDLYRSPDSSLAGIGLCWAKRRAAETGMRGLTDAYVDSIFDGYWAGALDLEDVTAIAGVLDSIGAGGRNFAPETLRRDYDEQRRTLYEAGVIEAPAYVVGEEVFIGREHLPMVRWLFRGKVGPPPI